jgi:Ca2+-binding RTX toxin-like protein
LLPVEFFAIDDINLVDRGRLTEAAMGDAYVRGTNLPETFRFVPVHATMARVQIGAADRLLAIPGRAIVEALGGNDVVEMAFPLPAIFYGGDGDDTLTGNSLADKLVGGAGRDRIDGRTGDNTLWGDWESVELARPDTLANRQALAEALPGRIPELLFADIITAQGGHNTVYGGPGSDQITTAAGDDWVHAGQGADIVNSGAGHDRLFGGEGNDTLYGGDGDDLADGGLGNDTLRGAGGHDVLIGGAGNDILEGEAGNDALFDGSLRIGGLAANARAKGDAADAALAALLADWRLDFAIGLALVNDFSGTDRLRGGLGRDAFSALFSAEILDLLLLDDRRL